MEDFDSKYSGEQVEALLDQVASGNAGGGGGGGITVETDPIFSASPAAAISDEKIAEWDGKYAKPSGGIPKSDLTEEVQNALRYAEQDRGTVNAIKVNGKNIGANNGVVDLGNLGTYSTYIADFTMEELRDGIYNGTNIDYNTQALITAMNANKIILVREGEASDYKGVHVLNGYAEDLLYFSIVDSSGNILWCDGTDYGPTAQISAQTLHFHYWWDKQDILVSGENIKTINGESIVGSGDITIEQGAKGDKGDTGADGATFTPSVDSAGNLSWTNNKGLTNPPTVNIKGPKGDAGSGGGSGGPTIVEVFGLNQSIGLEDNTIYKAGPVTELEVYPLEQLDIGSVVRFRAIGDCTITISDVYWANGVTPTIEEDVVYELSLASDENGELLAVLTPFKPVE